jgi:hypothetical protein
MKKLFESFSIRFPERSIQSENLIFERSIFSCRMLILRFLISFEMHSFALAERKDANDL